MAEVGTHLACTHLIHAPNKCNTATHCNTLRHTATHCNSLQHATWHCNTLQHAATCWLMHRINVLHRFDVCYDTVTSRLCNTQQHTATHCNTLQHTATHCNTLQHTATHCNTLQHTTPYSQSKQRINVLHRFSARHDAVTFHLCCRDISSVFAKKTVQRLHKLITRSI